MDQLQRVKVMIDEIRIECEQILNRVHSTTNLNEVKNELEKLLAFNGLLAMILEDMMDSNMHRMYWPTHQSN